MAPRSKTSSRSTRSRRLIGRPNGTIQPRVRQAGPERFGIVAVDCAKRRCKWMLTDFYGNVIVEPTTVDCNREALRAMTLRARSACDQAHIVDCIVAVELTGVYHKPVVRAFRKADFETREVHPYASKHYRSVAHPDRKTDDNDLEGIFQAACHGFGLIKPPVDEVYQTLQIYSRHRRNLIGQRSRLKTQIRHLMHQSMPGYADLFEQERFFTKSIAIDVARHFQSAARIRAAGSDSICRYLKQQKIRFRRPTVERIIAWSASAADADPLALLQHSVWCDLDDHRRKMTEQIQEAERKMAVFLAKTPYILLLSVAGINVVTAAELAGEAGPIEFYASAAAINGRAGLFPSCYQSDEVAHNDGPLARHANRRLRSSLMRIADCVSKHHPKYRGLSEKWRAQKVDPRDWHCRIANRISRLVFQLVSGRQFYRRRGVAREYLLGKLLEFHRQHETPADATAASLSEAIAWLPKSTYGSEAEPLKDFLKKRSRRVQPIGNLILPLLIRLGVQPEPEVNSTTSEAQG